MTVQTSTQLRPRDASSADTEGASAANQTAHSKAQIRRGEADVDRMRGSGQVLHHRPLAPIANMMRINVTPRGKGL